MIWGLTLEPGKQYTRVTGGEIQLSMATLESRDEFGSTSDIYSHVVLRTPRQEYLLCTLVHGTTFQQGLDLKLRPTETVTFSVQGTSIVYLTGYSVEDTEVEDQIEVEVDPQDQNMDNSIGLEGEYEPAEATDTGMEGGPGNLATIEAEEEVDRKPIITPVIKQEPQDTLDNTQGFPASSGFPIKQEVEDITEISDDAWDQEDMDPSAHIHVSLGQDGPQTSPQETMAHQEAPMGPADQQRVPNEHYLPPQQGSRPSQNLMQAQNTQPGQPQGQQLPWAYGTVPPSPATILHRRGMTNPQTVGPGGVAISQGRPSASQLPDPVNSTQAALQRTSTAQVGHSRGSLQAPTRQHQPKEKAQGNHKQGLACQYCGMVATNATQLKVHMRSHTGEKTFNCSVCGKLLSNFNSKVRHERSHLGVRPFPCRYCPKTFTQPHHRKRHEAAHVGT